MAKELSERLRRAIAETFPKLCTLGDQEAGTRADGSSGWSHKQELGHLLDSAVNNRVRFVVATLEGKYAGPTYDGEAWVEVGSYGEASWDDLVNAWRLNNDLLARAVERIPAERLQAECRIGDGRPVTLEFIIDDYIAHMQHHLDHIFGKEELTAYPGAAAGI